MKERINVNNILSYYIVDKSSYRIQIELKEPVNGNGTIVLFCETEKNLNKVLDKLDNILDTKIIDGNNKLTL